MQEIRCNGTYKGKPCTRLLFKNTTGKSFHVEIKCPKCGETWNIYQSELMDFSGNRLEEPIMKYKD